MRQAERLKQTLEREIVLGIIRPGERLEEVDMANRFNVSRTPVREALMMLEGIRLIERHPNKGATVRSMTLKRLIHMIEYLTELEALAARLAAKRIQPEAAEALKKAQQACVEAAEIKEPDHFYNMIIEFHRAIYAASGNEELMDQMEVIGPRIAPFARAQHHQEDRMHTTIRDHVGIVDAILSGDSDLADSRMRAYIRFDNKLFAEFASNMPAS